MLLYILMLIIGGLIGSVLSKMMLSPKNAGTLKVWHDGKESYLFLELDQSLHNVENSTYVTFKVDPKQEDTHK